MQTRKYRWSKVYESSEEELNEILRSQNINAQRLATDTHGDVQNFTTTQPTTIWCAEGSCTLIASGKTISLQPGDAVQLPTSVDYEITAGISGYVYYQAATE